MMTAPRRPRKPRRGGYREGAGRKPLDPSGAKRPYTVHLSPAEAKAVAALVRGTVPAGLRELVRRLVAEE